MTRSICAIGFGLLGALTANIAWGQHIVTAGPDGDYATIQEAIDDALAWVDGEVRIQAGSTYEENLQVTVPSHQYFSMSGGWNNDFDVRSDDPTLTVVDGALSGRVVRVDLNSGSTFYLQNLTFVDGEVMGDGGGVFLQAVGADEVGVYGNVFRGNLARSTDESGQGGGLAIHLNNTYAEVNNNRFFDNGVHMSAAPTVQTVLGGGLSAYLKGSSHLQLQGNLLNDSFCRGSDGTTGLNAYGCSVYVHTIDSSTLDMAKNVVLNSRALGFTGLVRGVAGYVQTSTSGTVAMERNRWQGASVVDCPGSQPSLVHLIFGGETPVTQRSSLIADSPADGLFVEKWFGAADFSWQAVNLTVANNGGNGLQISDDSGATLQLSNSLVFGNDHPQINLIGGADLELGSNLIGADPGCVNPAGGFYQLASGAVALEAGDNNPPGGLTTLDLGGESRLQDTWVDVGAYEGTRMIWADGFENGESTLWSDQTP